ncbi:MAG: 50S ribosomal protein L21 [Calditrichaeota bacterium]|nr:50S ribosomal protein L21 [Calditrichota bacterium]
MYAIVDIAGEQIKVSKDQQVITSRLEAEVGSKVEFENVLLLSTDEGAKIGAPFVDGAKVTATVLAHNKAKKVEVFKKKRRKGFKVHRGHRQPQTKIQIDEIAA